MTTIESPISAVSANFISNIPITSNLPLNNNVLAYDATTNTFVYTSIPIAGLDLFQRINDATTTQPQLVYNPAASVLATDNFVVGPQTTEGAGTKMMFLNNAAGRQGAFRAGTVSGAQWDLANCGVASAAFGLNTTASGAQSFASGSGCQATAAQSTAIGLTCNATGIASISGGSSSVASAPAAVALGTTCMASGNGSTAMGTKCAATAANTFIWSDGTSAATINNAVANSAVFLTSGGYKIFTKLDSTTGVTLAADASSWAAVSDVNKKENLRELDYANVLELLVKNVPVYAYNFKGTDPAVKCMGPTAQDWHAAFPSAKDPLKIETMDLDGVALAAVKGLAIAVRKELADMKSDIDKIKHHLQL